MRFIELFESRDGHVYHAMDVDHAITALKRNRIEGRTFQRYWADGVRRKENDPLYKNSLLMKGISTTRDIRYVAEWKSVVFKFNLSKISQNYSVIPYAWNYHFDPKHNIEINHKREKEEFIILAKPNKTTIEYNAIQDQLDDALDNGDDETYKRLIMKYGVKELEHSSWLSVPEGQLFPLSKYIEGIYINWISAMIYGAENKKLKEIANHDKFIGLIKLKQDVDKIDDIENREKKWSDMGVKTIMV
ncbi:MAG: hypothetical protein WC284_07795 [Candidimonas sp.]